MRFIFCGARGHIHLGATGGLGAVQCKVGTSIFASGFGYLEFWQSINLRRLHPVRVYEPLLIDQHYYMFCPAVALHDTTLVILEEPRA